MRRCASPSTYRPRTVYRAVPRGNAFARQGERTPKRLVAARPTVMPPPPGHGRRHLRSIPILPHVPTSPSTRWFGSRGKPRLFIAVLRCSYRSLAQTNRPKPSGGGWGRSYTCTRDLAGSGPHLSVGDGDETVTWQRTKEKQRT
jgi:hypothetical protein